MVAKTKERKAPTGSPMEWAEEITSELVKQPFYLPEKEFKLHCEVMAQDQKEIFLRQMRLEREFYKKIWNENHREKFPNSYRYVDAKIRMEIININGQLLKSMIND